MKERFFAERPLPNQGLKQQMAGDRKTFIYEDGVRFEVTPYGLICCLEESNNKKHDCPDCKFCQWCSHERCSGCRDQGRYHRQAKKEGIIENQEP